MSGFTTDSTHIQCYDRPALLAEANALLWMPWFLTPIAIILIEIIVDEKIIELMAGHDPYALQYVVVKDNFGED